MKAAHRPAVAVAVGAALLLGGCAGPQRQRPEPAAPAFRDAGLTLQAARDGVRLGQSLQPDVLAALGPTTVVRFASGYQVWVYRGRPDGRAAEAAEAPELVILFSPAGLAQQARIRLPPDRPR